MPNTDPPAAAAPAPIRVATVEDDATLRALYRDTPVDVRCEPVVREAKSPARPAQPQRPLAENATPRAAGARAAAGVGAVAITGPAQAAEAAARLMSEGQVRKARSVLLRQSEKQLSPDVAWALARSYDPNVLRGISKPDASADIRQAERWYREWHRLAVAQGLVASTVSVDRLIRAMRP